MAWPSGVYGLLHHAELSLSQCDTTYLRLPSPRRQENYCRLRQVVDSEQFAVKVYAGVAARGSSF